MTSAWCFLSIARMVPHVDPLPDGPNSFWACWSLLSPGDVKQILTLTSDCYNTWLLLFHLSMQKKWFWNVLKALQFLHAQNNLCFFSFLALCFSQFFWYRACRNELPNFPILMFIHPFPIQSPIILFSRFCSIFAQQCRRDLFLPLQAWEKKWNVQMPMSHPPANRGTAQ